MSQNKYVVSSSETKCVDSGLFLFTWILLVCGSVLLCEPLITLLEYYIMRNYIPTGDRKPGLMRIQAVLKLALLVALILGVYVSGSALCQGFEDCADLIKLESSYAGTKIGDLIVGP